MVVSRPDDSSSDSSDSDAPPGPAPVSDSSDSDDDGPTVPSAPAPAPTPVVGKDKDKDAQVYEYLETALRRAVRARELDETGRLHILLQLSHSSSLDRLKSSSLWTALGNGSDMEVMLKCLDELEEAVIIADAFRACREGAADEFMELLSQVKSASIDVLHDGTTLLCEASKYGHDHCVRILLENDASVNFSSQKNGEFPLLLAASGGHETCLRVLLKAGAEINKKDALGMTSVAAAAASGSAECLRILINLGAEINHVTDKLRRTALHHACINGNEHCVSIILESDVSATEVLMRDSKNFTPLQLAVSKGYESVVKTLLFHGAKSEPLMIKLKSPSGLAVCKHLERRAASVTYSLNMAVMQNKPDEVTATLAGMTKVDLNVHALTEESPKSALMLAAQFGRKDCLVALMESGKCDVNLMTPFDHQKNALLYAAEAGHVDCVVLLLATYGASLRASATGGSSVAHVAARRGHADVLMYLLTLPSGSGIEEDLSKRNAAQLTVLEQYLKSHTFIEPSHDLILALVQRDLPFSCDPPPCSPRPGHSFSWALLLDKAAMSSLSESATLDLVRKICESHAELVRPLATATNREGQPAIAMSWGAVRDYLYSFVYFCGRYEIENGAPLHRSVKTLVVRASDHRPATMYGDTFRRLLPLGKGGRFCLECFGAAVKYLQMCGYLTHFETDASDDEEIISEFDTLLQTSSPSSRATRSLTEAEFVSFCCGHLVGKPKIVMKFFNDEHSYQAELAWRSENETGQASLDNPQFVVEILPSPDADQLDKDVAVTVHTYSGITLADYPLPIFLVSGERDLGQIFRAEGLSKCAEQDRSAVATIMRDLCLCLDYVHEQGVVHLGLSMDNVVHVSGDRSFRLIDLKTCCAVGKNIGCVDEGFSDPSLLPPEFFFELRSDREVQKHREYWSGCSPETWEIVKPRELRDRVHKGRKPLFVCKAYLSSKGEADNLKLPYVSDFVSAAPRVDVWSFGLLLFHILSGEPLLSGQRDLACLCRWAQEPYVGDCRISDRIDDSIKDARAADLLRLVLRCDQHLRPSSMAEVLAHPYFDDALAATVDRRVQARAHGKAWQHFCRQQNISDESEAAVIKGLELYSVAQHREMNARIQKHAQQRETATRQMESVQRKTRHLQSASTQTLGSLHKSQQLLLKGLLEASTVTSELVPTCFVLTNQLLEPERPAGGEEGRDQFENVHENDPSWYSARAENANRMLFYLLSVSEALAHNEQERMQGRPAPLCPPMCDVVFPPYSSYSSSREGDGDESGDVLYLYLIDEFSMSPVVPAKDEVGAVYPIKVHKPADFLQRFLPLLRLNLKALRAMHGTGGVARALGHPGFARLQPDQMNLVQDAVGVVDHASRVRELDALLGAYYPKLQPGWRAEADNGAVVYIKDQSGESQSEVPLAASEAHAQDPRLLPGWSVRVDNVGHTFFAHLDTGETTRALPFDFSESKRKPKGLLLDELCAFLAAHDQLGSFSGLQRCIAPDGSCVWTSHSTAETMEREAKFFDEEAERDDGTTTFELENKALYFEREVLYLKAVIEEAKKREEQVVAEYEDRENELAAHVNKINDDLLAHIRDLTLERDTMKERLGAEHEAQVEALKQAHGEYLSALKREHASQLARIQQERDEDIQRAVQEAVNVRLQKPGDASYLQEMLAQGQHGHQSAARPSTYAFVQPSTRPSFSAAAARGSIAGSSPYDRISTRRSVQVPPALPPAYAEPSAYAEMPVYAEPSSPPAFLQMPVPPTPPAAPRFV